MVEQQQNIFLDEAWSAEWVDGVYDGQLNIQVRAHLENLIDLQDDTEGGSPEEKEKPFVQRAWPVLCKAVKAAVVEAAAEAKKAASENPDVVPPPAAKVVTPAQLLRDEDLKTWMLSLNIRFEGGFDDIVDNHHPSSVKGATKCPSHPRGHAVRAVHCVMPSGPFCLQSWANLCRPCVRSHYRSLSACTIQLSVMLLKSMANSIAATQLR